MPQPLISVIVPCYNQAQYLDECLQSVLDQTYENWECIIVNDGSPDNTEEIAKLWVEKDSRFKYLYKENGGLSSARNAGLEIANGEWIQFLDCDDKITNDKFELSSKYFDKYDLIITDFIFIKGEKLFPANSVYLDRDISYEDLLLRWDLEYTIPIHAAIFKTQKTQKFFETLKAKEDWIFWLDFFQNTNSYVIINKELAFYRMHEENMTKNLSHMLHNEELVYMYLMEHISDHHKKLLFQKILKQKNRIIIDLKKHSHNLEQKIMSKRYKIGDKIATILEKFKLI